MMTHGSKQAKPNAPNWFVWLLGLIVGIFGFKVMTHDFSVKRFTVVKR